MLEDLLREAQEAKNIGDNETAMLKYEQAIAACGNDENLVDWRAICLEELATICFEEGRYAEAISSYRKLIALGEKVLGSSHPDVITMIGKLALAFEADKQYEKADEAFRLAANRAERAFGLAHEVAQNVRQQYFDMLANRDLPTEKKANDQAAKEAGTGTQTNVPAIKVEDEIPVKKFSNLRQPKKIRKLRYGAESAQEKAANLLNMRNLRHHWRGLVYFVSVILGVVVLISSITVFGDLPIGNVMVQQPMEKGLFQSVDGFAGLDFIDNRYVLLTHDVWHHKIPYILLKGGTHDLWASFTSLITKNEQWYQLKHDRIISENGNVFYANGAHELSTAEKMRKLVAFAKRYYANYGCYPDKSEKLAAEPGLTYINPYNEKAEKPVIKRLNGVDSRDSIFPGLGAEATIGDTYNFLRHGGTWMGEINMAPGAVNALALFSLQRCVDGYKVNEFYVHGYDRDGKLLTAAAPGTIYVFGLHAGKSLTDENKERLQEIERASVHPPERIYVVPGEEVDLHFMHQFGFIVLSFVLALSFLFWIFLEARNRTENPRRMIQPVEAIFIILLFVLLAVLVIHWGG